MWHYNKLILIWSDSDLMIAIVYKMVVIHKLFKYTICALQLPWRSTHVKLLLDIHYVCLHTLYTSDENMHPVPYLLIGKGEIGWGVPKQIYTFWAKKSLHENSNSQLALYR